MQMGEHCWNSRDVYLELLETQPDGNLIIKIKISWETDYWLSVLLLGPVSKPKGVSLFLNSDKRTYSNTAIRNSRSQHGLATRSIVFDAILEALVNNLFLILVDYLIGMYTRLVAKKT